MGADNLDARLAPVAEFLLVIILMAMAATLASYLIIKVINRRKDQAHNKLSASRRGKDTGINLFGDGSDDQEVATEGGRSQRTQPRKRNSFNFLGFLREIAHRMERPKSRSRRKRRGRSSSDNLRIDILKKPQAGVDAKEDHPAP